MARARSVSSQTALRRSFGRLAVSLTLARISPPLGPGVHSFGVDCNQSDVFDPIDYDDASVIAVAISPN